MKSTCFPRMKTGKKNIIFSDVVLRCFCQVSRSKNLTLRGLTVNCIKLPSYRCFRQFTAVYRRKHAVSFEFTVIYILHRNYFEKYIRYFSGYPLEKKQDEFWRQYRRKIQFNVHSLYEFKKYFLCNLMWISACKLFSKQNFFAS